MYNSGSNTDITHHSDKSYSKRKSMQNQASPNHLRNNASTSAAQQYLNNMALSQALPGSTRQSNRSVANTTNRSNFRSTNSKGQKKLEPLPPRGANRSSTNAGGGGGSVSGRKGQGSKNQQ